VDECRGENGTGPRIEQEANLEVECVSSTGGGVGRMRIGKTHGEILEDNVQRHVRRRIKGARSRKGTFAQKPKHRPKGASPREKEVNPRREYSRDGYSTSLGTSQKIKDMRVV